MSRFSMCKANQDISPSLVTCLLLADPKSPSLLEVKFHVSSTAQYSILEIFTMSQTRNFVECTRDSQCCAYKIPQGQKYTKEKSFAHYKHFSLDHEVIKFVGVSAQDHKILISVMNCKCWHISSIEFCMNKTSKISSMELANLLGY